MSASPRHSSTSGANLPISSRAQPRCSIKSYLCQKKTLYPASASNPASSTGVLRLAVHLEAHSVSTGKKELQVNLVSYECYSSAILSPI
jgi:hypothetical protein